MNSLIKFIGNMRYVIMAVVVWLGGVLVLAFSEHSVTKENNKEPEANKSISQGCFQAQSRYCIDANNQLWDLKEMKVVARLTDCNNGVCELPGGEDIAWESNKH